MTRTATLMFTDVVESTARAVRKGPRQAESERVAHFELVRRVLAEHGGSEVKTLGDGVMAAFDSTVSAVDAAVALQQRLHESNRVNPDSVEVRVGLSVGEVDEADGDLFGPAVVEAARLCAEAAPGQVLCTFMVRALVQAHSGHIFDRIGDRALKGLPDPVAVEEVRWEALVAPGLHGNFATVDDTTASSALACLDAQREVPYFRAVRDRLMSLLAPSPGQTLVDVGSGTGHDALELARRVGAAGSVIGIDSSDRMVSEATERAKSAGVTNVEFRVCRAESLPFDDESVDGARSDRVLQYVADAPRVVHELRRITRPGGVVAVADTDWGVSMFDCDDLDLGARVEQAWTSTRASGTIGRRLYGLFVRAGFEDVEVFAHAGVVTDIGEWAGDQASATLYRDSILPGMAAQAVDAGTVTAEEASRWIALQREAIREQRFLRFVVMFVVAGRVPAT